MIKKFIDSIPKDKKDHVLLGLIIGFPLMVTGFIIDLITGGIVFTLFLSFLATLFVGWKEIYHDWFLKKGNPEWLDFLASYIPIFMMKIVFLCGLMLN